MGKLIILTGDIAAGKSTFSQILSKRYGIVAYNKDTIKELLADTIGFSNRQENLELSLLAVNIMTMIFEKHSELGKSLILEANFHRAELDRINKIAEANKIEVLTLVFEADIELLYERFRHRVEHENRHPAHQSAGLNSIGTFEQYVLESRAEARVESAVKVNANDFSYQEDAELLGLIDAFVSA